MLTFIETLPNKTRKVLSSLFFTFPTLPFVATRKQLWWVVGLWFLVLLMEEAFLASTVNISFANVELSFDLGFVFSPIISGLFIISVLRWFKIRLRDIGLRIPAYSQLIFWSFVASVDTLLLVFLSAVNYEQFSAHAADKITLVSFSLDFATVAIIAVAIEELVFRGIFFTLFRSRMSVINAWIIQGILFGFAHILVQNPLSAIGPGLMFGAGMLGSGSLLPGLIGHFLKNAAGVLFQHSLLF